jgi:hypothetical protein
MEPQNNYGDIGTYGLENPMSELVKLDLEWRRRQPSMLDFVVIWEGVKYLTLMLME